MCFFLSAKSNMSNSGISIKRGLEEGRVSSELQYKCSVCKESFEKASLMLKHYKTHNAEKSGSSCGSTFRIKDMTTSSESSVKQEENDETPNKLQYWCKICNEKFYNASLLGIHQKSHRVEKFESKIKVNSDSANYVDNSTKTFIKQEYDMDTVKSEIYTCNMCNEQFDEVSSIISHEKTHSVEESQNTDLISKSEIVTITSDFDIKTVKEFKEDLDAEISYKCNVCHKLFKNASLLLRHQKIHNNRKLQPDKQQSNSIQVKDEEVTTAKKKTSRILKAYRIKKKRFECDICGYKAVALSILRVHILGHYGVTKPYECQLCNYKCDQKNRFKSHQLKHTGEKPFKCSLCKFRTTHNRYLTCHILRCHDKNVVFGCHICSFSTRTRNKLIKHVMIKHSTKRVKSYECNRCSYETTRLYDFKSHLLVHTGEKPLQCNYCDFRCLHQNNLNKHVRTHTGEKPYQCHVCGCKFTQWRGLNKHKTIHEEIFKCNICHYECNSSSALDDHKKQHYGLKNYRTNLTDLKQDS